MTDSPDSKEIPANRTVQGIAKSAHPVARRIQKDHR